jgi:hypothetical protein
MVFKRIARWFGRRFGWFLNIGWDGFKAFAKWIGILLLIIIGAILTFAGELVLLILGAILTIFIFLLKAFAYVTEKLMVTTKWFGSKLSDFTENFYDGITDIFKKEEELLNREISFIIKAEKR